jgi:hypothetical protein
VASAIAKVAGRHFKKGDTVRFSKGVVSVICGLAAVVIAVSCTNAPDTERTGSSAAPASVASPTTNQFVVLANQTVTLGSGDHSLGGAIGVNTVTTTSPQLTVGSLDGLDLFQPLIAPSVAVGNLAVTGPIETNALTNNGGHVGMESAYPSSMPPLPLTLTGSPGTTSVTVAQGQVVTLSPGNFGALTDSGVLLLAPGAYSFASITLGNRAQILAQQPGSTSIYVGGALATGTFAQIFPVGQPANELTITVAGNDGSGGSSPVVSIGANSQLVALLLAPNGTVSLANNVQATGAFAGVKFVAGNNVSLVYQSGFPSPSPTASSFVAYAERSVTLAAAVHSVGGDIGVASAVASNSGSQLTVGSLDGLDPKRSLFAPSIALGSQSLVGDVETNALTNNGGIFGTQAPYPAAAMPPIPFVLGGTPGTTNVTVPPLQIQNLTPGNYGALVDNGILNLAAGTYSFTSVTLGNNAQIIAQPGGPTVVQVAGDFVTGQGALVLPLAQPAAALTIAVVGGDAPSGSPTAASIGNGSQIVALLAAPNGTVSLGANVQATGSFAGFDVAVGNGAILNFQSGFPPASQAPQGSQHLSGYYGNPSDGSFPVTGAVPPSTVMELDVGLPMRQAANFQAYLAQVSDPNSASYGQYISRGDFSQNYAETPATYSLLTTWAQGAGLSTLATSSDNLMLSVTGTAAQIEQAFFTNLVYRARGDGTNFVTVDREPSVNLAPTILWVAGFDDSISATPSAGPSCGDPPNPANPTPAAWSKNPTAGPPKTSGYWAVDIRNAYLGGTPCQTLTGKNQVVGLLEMDSFLPNDLSLYDTNNPPFPGAVPPLNPSNVSFGFGSPGGNPSSAEAILDVAMVQAMAPAAQVVVFEGNFDKTLGFPNGHADALLKAMSTNASLTTASNSWNFAKDANAQQDVAIMAGLGVSYFVASGDFGNIGDPGDDRDMDQETLVGGTFLSTNALGGVPYYRTEYTWNQGCPGKDITCGGIMNGALVPLNGFASSCFPAACSGVDRPGYQRQISLASIASGGAGASGTNRNFPDVALTAQDLALYYQGNESQQGGTSAASPLWAGFMALERELAATNGVGPRGFLNPVLYAIGQTKGAGGVNDLYSFSFNDVADGVTNLPPPNTSAGFPSVAGYDLATGWGTPTCGLIQQLANFNPLIPSTFGNLFVHLANGHDGVNDASSVTLDVFTSPTTLLNTYILKGQGEQNWGDRGQVHDFTLQLQDSNGNPVRLPANGIDHFILHLFQNGQSGDDNWDVGGIRVALGNLGTTANPGSEATACELDLSGNQVCQIPCAQCDPGNSCGDGQPEVVRLSATPSASGVGGGQSFPAGPQTTNGGCLGGGFAKGSAEPFAALGITFDTGGAGLFGTGDLGTSGLRSDSELDLDILDGSGNNLLHYVLKPGGSLDSLSIQEDTEEGFDVLDLASIANTSFSNPANVNNLPGGVLHLADFATMRVSLVSHNSGGETNDSWAVDGVYVSGIGGDPTAGGQSFTCLFSAAAGEPEFSVTDGSPIVMAKQANCPF